MALPLLQYKPTTQNQRVASFGVSDQDEETPYLYRWEDTNSDDEKRQLIWAVYRQVFSEHATIKFNRQAALESQMKNGVLTVRDFIRGLVKTNRFYETVVAVNDNYRLVEICLKRFLGRAPYNQDEKISWSIKIGTLGFYGFVDALLDSEEYTEAFGDFTVPYQRKRMEGRPFNLVTPRYGEDYREVVGTTSTDWRFVLEKFYTKKYQDRQLREGDPKKFQGVAAALAPKGNYAQRVSAFDIDYLNKVPVRSR